MKTKEIELNLIKKIVEILSDYKFSSTQEETAEMTARRVIGIINTQAKQEVLGEVMKIIDNLDKGESWISKEELKRKLEELR